MDITDFSYHLPEELIAQHPVPDRTGSRMLIVDRRTGACELRNFTDFPEYLQAGDCLVLNDTRVIPARLFGHRHGTGGQVEILLLEENHDRGTWQCMLRPGRRLHSGDRITIDGDSEATAEVSMRRDDGTFEVTFSTDDVDLLIERCGQIPLPPYIQRDNQATDRDRYQTVYAQVPGAVAAPTAGLHFSGDMLDRIRRMGVETVFVTLHVGPGTFKPVKAERIEDHQMHEERYVLTPAAAATINQCRARGNQVIAIGTTSVRVIETCADRTSGQVIAGEGRTRLFMHPPMRPQITDALLTNFHLPRSTLLMLVSTFSSVDNIMAAYQLAMNNGLRFYSYGDCMLLI